MGSSQSRDRTCVSCLGRRILSHWTTREGRLPPSHLVALGSLGPLYSRGSVSLRKDWKLIEGTFPRSTWSHIHPAGLTWAQVLIWVSGKSWNGRTCPYVCTSAVPASPSLWHFPGTISCLPPPSTLRISHFGRGCGFQSSAAWPPSRKREQSPEPCFPACGRRLCWTWRPFGDHASRSAWISPQLHLLSLIIVHGDTCHSQNVLFERQMFWST